MKALEEIFEFNIMRRAAATPKRSLAQKLKNIASGKNVRDAKANQKALAEAGQRIRSRHRDEYKKIKGKYESWKKHMPSDYKGTSYEAEAVRNAKKKVESKKAEVNYWRSKSRQRQRESRNKIATEQAKRGALYGGAGLAAIAGAKGLDSALDGAYRRRRNAS